jgi:hypothetical protein
VTPGHASAPAPAPAPAALPPPKSAPQPAPKPSPASRAITKPAPAPARVPAPAKAPAPATQPSVPSAGPIGAQAPQQPRASNRQAVPDKPAAPVQPSPGKADNSSLTTGGHAHNWPSPVQPRAPKIFKGPGAYQQHYQGPSAQFSGRNTYDLPEQGPQPYGQHLEQYTGKGGKPHKLGHKHTSVPKRDAISKKELAKKTVWELMLHAAGRAPSPGPQSHEEYYDLWREYSSVRRVYTKLGIEPRFNPCKFVKEWHRDTRVTFGVLVSRRGVLDTVTPNGGNPVGLAFPQIVVREGSALVVYSFSGPKQVPGKQEMAFPGENFRSRISSVCMKFCRLLCSACSLPKRAHSWNHACLCHPCVSISSSVVSDFQGAPEVPPAFDIATALLVMLCCCRCWVLCDPAWTGPGVPTLQYVAARGQLHLPRPQLKP